MKQLVVISGKGGTGKTILSASFASLAESHVMADCDVDAANLYLILHPEVQETHDFSGGQKARLDPEKCTGCGACFTACRFQAVEKEEDGTFVIDPISCEGCGICFHVCPVEAIEMENSISGRWFVSRTKYGPFVHARLHIGEENSGKLVTEVRKKAKDVAEDSNMDLVIIDGPPGIGCPVIASLSGADLALVVTEPSLSGIHDMERIVQVSRHFKIRTACCINKFDINLRNTEAIEKWCESEHVPVLGKIPYDEDVVKSMVQGIPLPEFSRNAAGRAVRDLWGRLGEMLDDGGSS